MVILDISDTKKYLYSTAVHIPYLIAYLLY